MDLLEKVNNNTLELYYDETPIVYDTIVIPSGVVTLVSDYISKKIVLPHNLKVLDLNFEEQIILDCNLPKLEYCKMINIHWPSHKPLQELFQEGYYYYNNCTIDSKPLNEIIQYKYNKYFNETLTFKKNIINQRLIGTKIKSLIQYETILEKCKARSNAMKEELLMYAFHPVFVAKWFAAGLHPSDM